MPNVGRPSGGCHSCKRMKVRCDEERPSCRRCIGANRSCPGYGPVSDVFRRANVASKGRFVTLSTAKTPAIAATRDPTATETSLAHRPLPVDWEACGVSMFIHHYTIPDLDPVYGGYMPSLPEFYSANTGVGYLRNAMLAVSQALLAHDAKSEPMFLKAREYRAQAFRDLRPALLDEHEAISDHVLLALFLLERFEVGPAFLCSASATCKINLLNPASSYSVERINQQRCGTTTQRAFQHCCISVVTLSLKHPSGNNSCAG